jgi:hypothetical protein
MHVVPVIRDGKPTGEYQYRGNVRCNLLHCICRFLALLGPCVMSDLSPQAGAKMG